MSETSPADQEHELFKAWAQSQGVKIHKVSPKRIAGKGVGIVATSKISIGDTLTFVPESALITVDSVPTYVKRAIGDITVHGLLAVTLTVVSATAEGSSKWSRWRAVWPSQEDFKDSNPLMWPTELQEYLPAAAKDLLRNQEEKLEKDFTATLKAFPGISRDQYLYHWLVVNTRTFYYAPQKGNTPLAKPDDCMALVPLADYFNHADSGCPVTFESNGFTIRSDRVYDAGEEVFVSYGNHSNDFLLTEYGFIMTENRWDEISLDHTILPVLSETQKGHLKHAGFLGNYVLDKDTVCYRTQVALRAMILPMRQWHRFVEGVDDGEKDQANVDARLVDLLEALAQEARDHLVALKGFSTAKEGPCNVLKQRWNQILGIIEGACRRLKQ